MSNVYYWDANIFLSYLNGIPDRVSIIEDYLWQSRKKECRIFTSTWSITEVAFEASEKGKKLLDPAVERRIERFWADKSVITLVEVFPYLQREARRLMREGIPHGWSLKPVDAVHLATAVSDVVKASEFHTYDHDFKKYEAITSLKIGPPNPVQQILSISQTMARATVPELTPTS